MRFIQLYACLDHLAEKLQIYIMKKLANYLVQGIVYLAPLGLTAYLIYVTFNFLDGLSHRIFLKFFDLEIPGLGLLSLLVFLIFIGFLGKTIIAQPLKKLFNGIVERIPVLNFVYSALSDLFSSFAGKEKKFKFPVIVKTHVDSNMEKLGFITEEKLDFLEDQDKVAVYFPHSYNFSGELFIVPKALVRRLDVNSGEMMKFIVSAGLAKAEDH